MESGNYPISRTEGIVVQESGDELLIYDLESNKAYCLNPTSALVWSECDGTKSVPEMGRRLSKRLKTNISDDIVSMALSQFKRDNLLANRESVVTEFDGLSRREVIRRVGFASVVALPVISSLLAPTPLNAQSVAGSCFPADNAGSNSAPGCACVGTFDCCGICGAGSPMTCVNAPRGGVFGDPGAAPSCFPTLTCFVAMGNSGSASEPGCPCIGTFDCCGICGASGFCVGPTRGSAPGDPGGALSCP